MKPQLLPCGRPLPAPNAAAVSPAQWREKLKGYLEREGLKHSDQRYQIAEIVLGAGGHLSTQDILRAIQKEQPGIGAATVYRNMSILVGAGILRETLLDDQNRAVYEPAGDEDDEHHDHIVCLDCGAIFEFHEEKIEKAQTQVTDRMGFRQVRHRHMIYARCEKLKARSR